MRQVEHGGQLLGGGEWRVACGVWHVACGVRPVACGLWPVVCGVWLVSGSVCWPKSRHQSISWCEPYLVCGHPDKIS